MAALQRQVVWTVNAKRRELIRWREAPRVPSRHVKRAQLRLNLGRCSGLTPGRPNHVWSYGFVHDRTHDGRAFRMASMIDEFAREALMIRVDFGPNTVTIFDVSTELFIVPGPSAFVRSDEGPPRLWWKQCAQRATLLAFRPPPSSPDPLRRPAI